MKPSPQPQSNPTQIPLIPYRTEPPSKRFSHSYRGCNQGFSDSAKTVQVHPDSDGFYNHLSFAQSEPKLGVENRAGRRSRRDMDPNFLMPPEPVFGRREPDLYALGHRVNPTHHSKTRQGSVLAKESENAKPQAQPQRLDPITTTSTSHSAKSKRSTSKAAATSFIPSSPQSTTLANKQSSHHSSLSKKHQPRELRDLRYLYDWSNLPYGPPPPIYADHIAVAPVDKIPYRTEPPNARMSRSFRQEEPQRPVTQLKEISKKNKENMKERQSVQVLPKAPAIGEIRRKSVRIGETTEVTETPTRHGERVNKVVAPKRSSLKEVEKLHRVPTTYSPSTSSSRTAVELDADTTAADSSKSSSTTVTIVVPSKKPITNVVPEPMVTPTPRKLTSKPELDSVVERGRTLHRSLRRSRSAPLRSPRSSSSSSEDNDSFCVDAPTTLRRSRAFTGRKPRPRPLDLRTVFKIQELTSSRVSTGAQFQGRGQTGAELATTNSASVSTPAAPRPVSNVAAIPAPTVIAVGPLTVHFAGAPEIISFYTCSSSDEDGVGNVSDSDTLDDAHDAGSVQDVDAIMSLGLPGRTKDGNTPHPAKERFSFQSTGGRGHDGSSYRESGVGGLPTPQTGLESAYPSVQRPHSILSATVSTGAGEPKYTVVKTGPNGEVPEGIDKLNLFVRRWSERERRHSHFFSARTCEMKYDVGARQIYYETTFDYVLLGSPGEVRKENFYPFRGEVEWRMYH